VLVAVAQRLSEIVRDEDVLARVGGDEFALLLPETRRVQAFATVERARAAVATELLPRDVRLTLSAGICDLDTAGDADRLVRLADGALYWSKAHGRNVSWIYDPAVVRELSADERAAQLERSNAMLGIRALARAIDAKDPSTHEHSERVAALAEAMARARGWAPERVSLLRDAALVHDVGKIGVRDAVLLKPGALTREEHEEVKRHATLGADIVADVLFPEQVVWVRSHHERPDGAGYPDGLTEPDIPEGARLLAVADAYDVMTVARPYSDPKQPAIALAECRQLAGRQFDAEAVEALWAVVESGAGSLTSADTQESAAVPGPERGGNG
jgi:putative nucleotidyltransferase with HDIG domain